MPRRLRLVKASATPGIVSRVHPRGDANPRARATNPRAARAASTTTTRTAPTATTAVRATCRRNRRSNLPGAVDLRATDAVIVTNQSAPGAWHFYAFIRAR